MHKGTFVIVLAVLSLAFPLAGFANTAVKSPPFTERTPAYFVDRYGSGMPSKAVFKHSFVYSKRGSVEITGQFSVREFRSGDLRVQAVFSLPGLKLVAARLQLPRQWTDEQVQAALDAYGSGWKRADSNLIIKEWITPAGLKAINLLTFVEIQSPEILKALEQAIAESDAKRKAIPKF